MEVKKNKVADLHYRKPLLRSIGFFMALSAVTMAFEWKSYDDQAMVDLGRLDENFEDLLEIPPTQQPPPPPPKIQQPELVEIPDEEEIEEEIDIDLDVEITEDEVIEDIILDEAPVEEVAQEVFVIVEEPATPQGGYEAFYQYIAKNMRYPAQARRMGIEGRVFVQFIVTEDGSLKEVKAVRGISEACDAEAVRIVKKAAKWNPPKQRGKPVQQRVMVQIRFQLN